ncbi:FtsX-like permease family protein [Streptomyces sp. RY43-2]|uniref:FtsX-like permease family protein n=1 Tax=Streptomyces macrolidinus TaxID=2952607 RepID=A0ABT0Z877_9ACTN|nr:FtsX-like permease family protein [Streptomyces macrolidinus]MCN9239968.1 FtsX-like permease family protein [Streptomyces macrolidinus]
MVLTTLWGVYFESSLRMKAIPQRFAAADIVVDGDPWVKDTEPGGRRLQAILPDKRPLPQDLVDQVRAVPGVRDAVADRPFYAQFVGQDGKAVRGPDGGPSRGHSWATAALAPFRVLSGRPPGRTGEVMPDRRTAEAAGVRPGAKIRVMTASGTQIYRVSGIAEHNRTSLEKQQSEASLFFFDDEAADLARDPGGSSGPYAIAVKADSGVGARQLASRISDQVHAPGARVLHGDDKGEAEGQEVVEGRDFALAVSASFGLLAALFATVIVIGPFTIAVQQRKREIALLRAVGATHGTVRGMLCGEALILTFAGVVIGGPLGLLLTGPVRGLFVSVGVLPSGLTLVRGPFPVLAAGMLTLVGTQAAALLAARRAVRIRPVEALREADRAPRRLSDVRVVAGILALVAGVVFTLKKAGGEAAVMQTLVQVAVLMLGFALLAPLVVRGGIALLGPVLAWLGGLPGRIAHGALRADSRRLASAVVPLVVVCAFAGAVVFTGATLEKEETEQAKARMADVGRVLVTDGADGLPPKVAQAAAKLPAVQKATPAIETRVVVRHSSPVGDILESFPAQGLVPQAASGLMDLGVSAGRLADVRGESMGVSTSLARKTGWRVGRTETVVLGDGATARLRVAALFRRSAGFGDVVVPHDLALQHESLGLDSQVYLRLRPSAANADEQVDELLERFPGVKVLNRQQAADRADTVSAADTRSRYLLLGTLFVFSAAAAATALTMASVQRKRDLALMRTLGADRHQLTMVVLWEWMAVSVLALLAGGALVALPMAVFSEAATDSMVPSMPMLLVVGTVSSTVLLALVANLLPAAMALRVRTLGDLPRS